MSFGKNLSQEFQKLTAGYLSNEIFLFTKLQDAFINLQEPYLPYHYNIDLIHGTKGHVDFTYTGTSVSNVTKVTKVSTPPRVTKELSDMMFVVVSYSSRQMRLLYLQNKVSKKRKDRFQADLLQLYLLRERCDVRAKNTNIIFNNPKILKGRFSSVGSYGVFYKDQVKQTVEMAYFPAEYVKERTAVGRSLIRSVEYDAHNFGKIKTVGAYQESQGEETLENFANALVDMKIGKVLLPSDDKRDLPSDDKVDYSYLYHNSEIFRNFINENAEYRAIVLENTNNQNMTQMNSQYEEMIPVLVLDADSARY